MAAEPVFVFDACAIVALLQGEPGAEEVVTLLEKDENRCRIHALNVCEVFYDGLRRGSLSDADSLDRLLTQSGFEIETELPLALWETAGRLKAELRRVSLADCFAVALTLRHQGTLVTSDHHELDPLAASQVCPIQFIR